MTPRRGLRRREPVHLTTPPAPSYHSSLEQVVGCSFPPGCEDSLRAAESRHPSTTNLAPATRSFPLPLPHTATVTRRKVAGMDVASSLWLAFWALKRASSSACRSASRPFAAAASNAFMVGP